MKRNTLLLIGLFLTAGVCAALLMKGTSPAPKADNVEAVNEDGFLELRELYHGGDCKHLLQFDSNEGSLTMHIIPLHRDGENPSSFDEAKYEKTTGGDGISGEYRFTIEDYYDDGTALTGSFRLNDLTKSEGIVRLTLLNDWPRIGKANQSMDFYISDSHPIVKMGSKPTAKQLLKGIYPYTMDVLINDLYQAIIQGMPNENEGILDVTDEYIYYNKGESIEIVECRQWKCNDGNILFIINCVKNMPRALLTNSIWNFKYDPDSQTIEQVYPFDVDNTRIDDMEDETTPVEFRFLWHGKKLFRLELRSWAEWEDLGKNINLVTWDNDDDDEPTVGTDETLTWNGNGFDGGEVEGEDEEDE